MMIHTEKYKKGVFGRLFLFKAFKKYILLRKKAENNIVGVFVI